jgi:hypothetical protein
MRNVFADYTGDDPYAEEERQRAVEEAQREADAIKRTLEEYDQSALEYETERDRLNGEANQNNSLAGSIALDAMRNVAPELRKLGEAFPEIDANLPSFSSEKFTKIFGYGDYE